ncbi:VanW family protein [Clostridium formicaceticum]|uniref:Vancomycin B-type resistance protein VanW n=1 Tax=Clostridium formicaceticum TaxID=1497 RepID=A0AAC9WGH3_9CLOT|nr:VanW family protein [Clostridium formicaceticum]AOY76339.1 hypothetical protein BJL90_10745 [Clostridium formicaceticum]ARE86730.1 Vancomycin B-type resistance protein VanW [Clostridium formicaceticum]
MEPAVVQSKKKKIILWVIGMLFVTSFIALFTLAFFILNKNTIYPQVLIESVDVSNLTKQEAQRKIQNMYEKQLEDFKVDLVYENYSRQLAYRDLGYTYLYEEALEEAYGLGREGNLFKRIKEIYYLRQQPVIIPLKFTYDVEGLEDVLLTVEGHINQEVKDATIKRQNGAFHTTKEVIGIKVDREALKEKIMEGIESLNQETIVIPTEYVTPRIVEEKLKNIREVIGEFSTTFNRQQQGRSENISIASTSINGTLLMPTEEFSFNQKTGPRGVSEGYQEAPVIVNGQLVPGVGGGICQVSTTLYNAVVRANLQVTNRRNHSLPVAYVPLGQDATVSYNHIDFKFANNMENPIYIESAITGSKVFVKIYGKKEENMVITLASEVTEKIEPKTEIKQDTNMYLGEKKVERESKKGYRVTTYKVYSQNGKEIKREVISRDYYTPVNGVIIEGTKPKSETEKVSQEKSSKQETPPKQENPPKQETPPKQEIPPVQEDVITIDDNQPI